MLMLALLRSHEWEPAARLCVNSTFRSRWQVGNHHFILNYGFTLYKPHPTSRTNYAPDKEETRGPREPSTFRRTEDEIEELQRAANLATTKGILMAIKGLGLTLLEAEIQMATPRGVENCSRQIRTLVAT